MDAGEYESSFGNKKNKGKRKKKRKIQKEERKNSFRIAVRFTLFFTSRRVLGSLYLAMTKINYMISKKKK